MLITISHDKPESLICTFAQLRRVGIRRRITYRGFDLSVLLVNKGDCLRDVDVQISVGGGEVEGALQPLGQVGYTF